ncbi:hypothetical protein MVEN_00042200 [Mycena venus]|uniref:Uncharacterized protein n=1 Tax=Mycena venus TaxID=2733690 RepID=A0A8H6Z769_9AGAR|nr:hypothetical protein MVEN_00042200 [Mycena venus]
MCVTTQLTKSPREPDDDLRGYIFTVPSIEEAKAALKAINDLLRPLRNTGAGYKKYPIGSKWNSASLVAAQAAQKGPWTAQKLMQWTSAFMKEPKNIPTSPYGSWNKERSVLEDADVANEIALHLQSLRKYVKATGIVCYIDQLEVKKNLGLKKRFHLVTAQR